MNSVKKRGFEICSNIFFTLIIPADIAEIRGRTLPEVKNYLLTEPGSNDELWMTFDWFGLIFTIMKHIWSLLY